MPRLPAEAPTGDRYWRALGLSQLLKLCLCPVEQLGGAVITAYLPTVNLIAHVPEKAPQDHGASVGRVGSQQVPGPRLAATSQVR